MYQQFNYAIVDLKNAWSSEMQVTMSTTNHEDSRRIFSASHCDAPPL